jgi:hypothetical protein
MVKGCLQDSKNSHIYLPQLVLNEGLPTNIELFSALTDEQFPLLYYLNLTGLYKSVIKDFNSTNGIFFNCLSSSSILIIYHMQL